MWYEAETYQVKYNRNQSEKYAVWKKIFEKWLDMIKEK